MQEDRPVSLLETVLPRELLERALAIDEREYGTEHREVAITLTIHRKE